MHTFALNYNTNPEHEETMVHFTFNVDKSMYPLLEELWKRRFITEYSCQGSKDKAYILFVKDIDAKCFGKFLDDNDIGCELSPREHKYGGGCSVYFPTNQIENITKLIQDKMSMDHNPWLYDSIVYYQPKKWYHTFSARSCRDDTFYSRFLKDKVYV